MADRETFAQYVRDALAHLYDRAYLRAHPLARLLARGSPRGSGGALHSILLEAVEQIKPPRGAPPLTPTWRQYRYLVLRYVEGIAHKAIARELQVSVRQARRDHWEALEAVASILLETYAALEVRAPKARPTLPSQEPSDSQASQPPAGLDTEVARIGLAAAEQTTSAQEAIGSVLGIVGSLVEARGTRVELALPAAPLTIATSRTVLRQLLLTILTYAAETTHAARLILSATESNAGVCLRLTVSESDGVRDARAPAVQEPEEVQAMLASARQLAEAEGGSLQVGQSDDGSHYLDLLLPSTRTATVLIVDDDPDVPRLFRRYLRGASYRPVHARTAQLALRLAQETHPDVIVLDVLMPTQDGWEVLQQLRERRETRHIPIVICSVLSAQPIARSLGVGAYLSKPVTRQSLLAALDDCCRGRGVPAEHQGNSSRSP